MKDIIFNNMATENELDDLRNEIHNILNITILIGIGESKDVDNKYLYANCMEIINILFVTESIELKILGSSKILNHYIKKFSSEKDLNIGYILLHEIISM
jgi:hypothetical protein